MLNSVSSSWRGAAFISDGIFLVKNSRVGAASGDHVRDGFVLAPAEGRATLLIN